MSVALANPLKGGVPNNACLLASILGTAFQAVFSSVVFGFAALIVLCGVSWPWTSSAPSTPWLCGSC